MRRVSILAVALIAIGCSSHSGAAPLPNQNAPLIFQKHVNQLGWIKTRIPPINGYAARPYQIIADGSHHMWVGASPGGIGEGPGVLDEILMNGPVKTMPISVDPARLAFGPDQNFWVTSWSAASNSTVSRITPLGVETDFAIAPPNTFLENIISGPDGALWIAECTANVTGGIGRIDTNGNYTFYPWGPCILVISNGPDGNIWFGDRGQNIYDMSTGGVLLGTYPVGDSSFEGLTPGSDGALYATGVASDFELVRVTTGGIVTHIGNDGPRGRLEGIVSGPDGNLWISAIRSSSSSLITFNPTTQTFGSVFQGPPAIGPSLAVGPDSNIWATAWAHSSVETFIWSVLSVTPTILTISVGQNADVNVHESNYSGQWTAVSAKPSIATVTPNSNNGTFVVTGVTRGTTAVAIYDSKYNSVEVKVTVK
jgi:streptogramin lyase